MNNKNIDKYIKIFLIILGFSMFCLYIWFRFIRERLPKDLPFIDLSEFGLLRLCYICGIYFFIVFCFFKKGSNSNEVTLKIVEIIYLPLKTFDKYLKEKPLIKNINKKYLLYLSKKPFWKYTQEGLFYFYFFEIFPRILLITALIIDVYYFHKLYFIYKVLFIGILILIGKYLKYSYKALKDQIFEEHSLNIEIHIDYFDGLDILEKKHDENELEEDGVVPPFIPVPLDKFLFYQTNLKLLDIDYKPYDVFLSSVYYDSTRKKYNIPRLLPLALRSKIIAELSLIVKDMLDICYINAYLENKASYKSIKYLKILIFSNYFLIWLYIIVISLPHLKIDYDFLINLLKTTLEYTKNYEKPF